MKVFITALQSLALFAAAGTTTVEAAGAVGIRSKIIKEQRFIVFNSRQLNTGAGECMQVCTQYTDTSSIPVNTDCPAEAPLTMECIYDTDCIEWPQELPRIYGSCPKCVKPAGAGKDAPGKCVAYEGKGNLNCCKRTPGNDLVITNGCGANNVCVGFNDNDQCNVNQHALHCNPCCPKGNIEWDDNGGVVKENGLVKVDQDACPMCTNDQGKTGQGLPAIYPIEFCVTENIKWKERTTNSKADMDLDATLAALATAAAGGTPIATVTTSPAIERLSCDGTPTPAPVRECEKADDCWAKYEDWMCPKCITETGTCVDVADVSDPDALAEFASGVKGNLNCCKRTPGNDNIITNGCGANNICIGFNIDDQCEVNDKAAYCNPYCPDGNVLRDPSDATGMTFLTDSKGTVLFDKTLCDDLPLVHSDGTETIISLGNFNGADNTGVEKEMVRIYPMTYCKCRDVKWKTVGGGETDTVTEMCPTFLFKEQATATIQTISTGACNCGDYGTSTECAQCSNCEWKTTGNKGSCQNKK